jgi:hypothetical protein
VPLCHGPSPSHSRYYRRSIFSQSCNTQSGHSSAQCCDSLETTARTLLLRISLQMIFLNQPKGNLKSSIPLKMLILILKECNHCTSTRNNRTSTPLIAKPISSIPLVFCVQAIYRVIKNSLRT